MARQQRSTGALGSMVGRRYNADVVQSPYSVRARPQAPGPAWLDGWLGWVGVLTTQNSATCFLAQLSSLGSPTATSTSSHQGCSAPVHAQDLGQRLDRGRPDRFTDLMKSIIVGSHRSVWHPACMFCLDANGSRNRLTDRRRSLAAELRRDYGRVCRQ